MDTISSFGIQSCHGWSWFAGRLFGVLYYLYTIVVVELFDHMERIVFVPTGSNFCWRKIIGTIDCFSREYDVCTT